MQNNKRWWAFVGISTAVISVVGLMAHQLMAPEKSRPAGGHQDEQPMPPSGSSKSDAEKAELSNQEKLEQQANVDAEKARTEADFKQLRTRIIEGRQIVEDGKPLVEQYSLKIEDQTLDRDARGQALIGLNAAKHRVLDAYAGVIEAQQQLRKFRDLHLEIPLEQIEPLLKAEPLPFGNGSNQAERETR